MATTKRWYKLTSGSKTMGGPGGRKLVFRRGDLLELTEEEARASAHQLEPAAGPVPAPAPAEKVKTPEPEKVEKRAAPVEPVEPPADAEQGAPTEPEPAPPTEIERVLEGNVGQVTKRLEKIDDEATLREVSRVEAADGKDRKGVHDAVEERIQALAGAGDEPEGEGGEAP